MAAEQLRRILLKEMGITCWFPRAPLPGAALSHEQCLQRFLDDSEISAVAASSNEAAPGSAAENGQQTGANAATSGVAQLSALLGKKPAESAAASIPALDVPDAEEVKPDKKSVPAPEIQHDARTTSGSQEDNVDAFGFSWFNVDKRLAVLAMLPEGNTRLTSSCRQMLARILAALHTPWQSLELGDQSFHWPFADDLGLPADAAAARQAVEGFIARRLREQNCAMLLVLCDGLPWFFQSDTNAQHIAAGSENPTLLRAHRQFGFTMLVTHSLHAMEKDAGLKREAWQSMQVLRERLNRTN